jgi:hypothetical protein
MQEGTPDETILAEGSAQALAQLADLLKAKGIHARMVQPPGSNPNS